MCIILNSLRSVSNILRTYSIDKLLHFNKQLTNILFIQLLSLSLFTHEAFSAFSFVSMSIIPIQPSSIGAIREFRFIRSVLFKIKLKISIFFFFKKSLSGIFNTVPKYIRFYIARVFTTQHFPRIVSFLFFHDSKSFSILSYTFIQFLL